MQSARCFSLLLSLSQAARILTAVVALGCAGCVGLRPLPKGISFEGTAHPAPSVRFLKDVTYTDPAGVRHSDQEIFDEVFRLIHGAQHVILVDMFLFNDYQGALREEHRALSQELTDALIARKRESPELEILVITDPINTVYGGLPSPHFRTLREAGIPVIMTRLTPLRDSNPVYSIPWRLLIRPFGNRPASTLPNPFGRGRVSLRSWLALVNFKANHRKILIADRDGELVGLVTSANPHDGSSAHSNVALSFNGPAVGELLETEEAVLAMGSEPALRTEITNPNVPAEVTVQVVTEKKIRKAAVEAIGRAEGGDRVDLVMFYLSNRPVVRALKAARARGVELRVVLDPNKDAFGRQKRGIPNRQVARELHRRGIPVRWYDTHGEQCHTKLLLVRYADAAATMILGSSNFTRRNLNDCNLETNVAARGPSDAPVFRDALAYVDLVWSNTPERHCTVPYSAYEDNALQKRVLYWIMETTGMSTF